MKRQFLQLIALSVVAVQSVIASAACPGYLNIDLPKLGSGETVNVCRDFPDRPLLIVNTASHCGFTPQFAELEALHQRYKDRGLVVLGFPSDDFRQEADTEAETARICYINYGVTFTMLSPISVKGDSAHPIFSELSRQSESPSWNFNKYLSDSEGHVVAHFGSATRPTDATLTAAIEGLLNGDTGN